MATRCQSRICKFGLGGAHSFFSSFIVFYVLCLVFLESRRKLRNQTYGNAEEMKTEVLSEILTFEDNRKKFYTQIDIGF